jgi:imidazolonepropionase
MNIVMNAGILCIDGIIHKVGPFPEIERISEKEGYELHRIEGPSVVLPGFIDAHTHIAFGGSRTDDFAKRLAGKSYLEIAAEGGGIWSSVKATRSLTQNELSTLIQKRANRCLESGVTTVEVKSGYGLNADEELKILRAISQAQSETVATLIPTCLAAHVNPPDFQGNNSEYLNYLTEKLFPQIKEENLCDRADIFVENGAFSVSEAETYLLQLRDIGFDLTVHADQFSTGGSELAVRLGAQSADHLEASGDNEIRALAKSKAVATALPGASIGLGMPFAPARKLLDQGACLAIASDWNPGSAPLGDLVTCASILATYEHLSIAEVLAGITFRAAEALGQKNMARLVTGMNADMVVYATNDYRDIIYYQGIMPPLMTIKKGKPITFKQE